MNCRSNRVKGHLLCALALAAVAPLVAQAPPQTAPQTPVFRASVRLIDVDVYVTDQGGRPIRGLTQDDFELSEDGKPQEIRTFTPIDLPLDVTGAAAPEPDVRPLPEPDVATNVDPGRTYVLLLDSPYMKIDNPFMTGLTYTMAVKRIAAQFIREALGPRDQMAVVHVQGTTSVSQGLTRNRDLLLAAVDRYGLGRSGAESAPDKGSPEIATRITTTYQAIQDISERLAVVGGRRKSIIWIGGQLPFGGPPYEDMGGDPPPPFSIIERFEPTLEKARLQAMAIATRHNVAVYPVDAMGLTTETSGPAGFRTDAPPPGFEIRRMSALRAVAEETGGSAVVGTNNFSGGYSRIVAENSTYYILGYSPANDRQDGKFHSIRVRVKNRPELIVHARRGYTAPDAKAKPEALPPLPNGVSEATRDALRSPAPVTGIGIDLVTAAFKGTGKEGSVVLDAQLRGAGLQLNSGERVTISYQAIDTDGKIVTGAYKAFTLDLGEGARKDVAAEGLRFVDRLSLPPGRYEIRFVADQPSADVLGSIVTHVEVPEFNAPLTMSGPLIASLSTSGHRTLVGDAAIKKALSADPTAVRRFPQSDELAVYVELYPAAGGRITPDDLGVTAKVLGRDGTASLSEEATALTPGDGAAGIPFRAQLPLSDLSPGAYVLRIEGRSSPDDEKPLLRHVPFTVVAD